MPVLNATSPKSYVDLPFKVLPFNEVKSRKEIASVGSKSFINIQKPLQKVLLGGYFLLSLKEKTISTRGKQVWKSINSWGAN